MGVYYDTQRKKYRAMFMYKGKKIHVGRYDTRLKATRALNKYRKELMNLPDPIIASKLNLSANPYIDFNEPVVTAKEISDDDLVAGLNSLSNESGSYTEYFWLDEYQKVFPEPTPTFRDRLKALWPRKKRNDN